LPAAPESQKLSALEVAFSKKEKTTPAVLSAPIPPIAYIVEGILPNAPIPDSPLPICPEAL